MGCAGPRRRGNEGGAEGGLGGRGSRRQIHLGIHRPRGLRSPASSAPRRRRSPARADLAVRRAVRRHTAFAGVEVAPLVGTPCPWSRPTTSRSTPTAPPARRPSREQDRLGGADHPPPERHCRPVPEQALAVRQQGHRDEDAACQADRVEQRKRQEAIAKEKGEAQDVGWGSQIRGYVLHPYTMVRTTARTSRWATCRGCWTATSTTSCGLSCGGVPGTARPRRLSVAVSPSRFGRARTRGARLDQSGGRRDHVLGDASVQREVDRLAAAAFGARR